MNIFLSLAIIVNSLAIPSWEDIIIAVDVSDSMFENNYPYNFDPHTYSRERLFKEFPPSDPDGFRWDGIQLLLDIASPNDRVAIVLYKADALVATSYIEGQKDGFVSIGQNRKLLKEMIGGFRSVERNRFLESQKDLMSKPNEKYKGYFDVQYSIPDAKKTKLPGLRSGTSTLNAVRLISKSLLKIQNDVQKKSIFLFTDGVESGTTKEESDKFLIDTMEGNQILRPGKKFFEDLTKRKIGEPASGFLKSTIGTGLLPVSDKIDVSFMGFTIGKNCDTELVRELVGSFSGKNNLNAYYHTNTNRDLLEKLQEVVWESRDMWRLKRKSVVDQNPSKFDLSGRNLWVEAGALIYCVDQNISVNPKKISVAPSGKSEILSCESHSFVRFEDIATRDNTIVEVTRNDRDEESVFVLGLKTAKPIFEYLTPLPSLNYSPIDAIPLKIKFNSDHKEIVPDDFNMQARFTKLLNGLELKEFSILVPLIFNKDNSDFSASYVMDGLRNPDSPANLDLIGAWALDITIEAKSGVLKGAARTMLRREINIVSYPKLKNHDNFVKNVLTNSGNGTLVVAAELDLQFPPSNLNQLVKLSTFISIPDSWPAGSRPPQVLEQNWDKNINNLNIGLNASSWKNFEIRKIYETVDLKVSPPWDIEGGKISITFSIIKEKFKLRAVEETEGIRLDLSGSTSKASEIRCWIDSKIDAQEVVSLTPLNIKDFKIKMTSVGDKNSTFDLKLKPGVIPCIALGKGERSSNRETAFKFDLLLPDNTPPGRFKGEIELGGAGLTNVLIPLFLDRDQPVFQVKDNKGYWVPVSQIEFNVQQGTDVSCPIRLVTFIDKHKVMESNVRKLDDLSNTSVGFENRKLPVNIKKSDSVSEHDVNFKVESSAFQGRYQSSLKLAYKFGEKDEELSVPVYFQVGKYALEAKPFETKDIPSLNNIENSKKINQVNRLFPSKDTKTKFQAAFNLEPQSFVGKKEVRWYVTINPVTSGSGPWQDVTKAKSRFKIKEIKASEVDEQDVSSEDPAKPRSTTAIDSKGLPVLVEIDTDGLAPGLYRGDIKFFAKVDGSEEFGDSFNLPVEVLVPGQKIEASWADLKATGRLGQPAKINISIKCFGLTPESGKIILPNADGSIYEEVEVFAPKNGLSDNSFPLPQDAVNYQVTASVNPKLIGPNEYKVLWEKEKISLPPWNIIGKPTVYPYVVSPDDEILVKVSLSRSIAKTNSIKMIATPVNDPSKPVDFEIFDNGLEANGDERSNDGIYTGKLKLNTFDRYVIRTKNREPKELDDAEVVVGYSNTILDAKGNFDQDPGWFGKVSWSDENILTIENKRSIPCSYSVSIKYFANSNTAKEAWVNNDFLNKLASEDLRNFDEKRDLWVVPFANNIKGEDIDKIVEGRLEADGALKAGMEAGLSEAARDGERSHPCFQGDQYVLVQVDLKWDDGYQVTRRNIVLINSTPWVYSAGPILLVGVIIFGFASYLFSKNYKAIIDLTKKLFNIQDGAPVADNPPDTGGPFKRRRPRP